MATIHPDEARTSIAGDADLEDGQYGPDTDQARVVDGDNPLLFTTADGDDSPAGQHGPTADYDQD